MTYKPKWPSSYLTDGTLRQLGLEFYCRSSTAAYLGHLADKHHRESWEPNITMAATFALMEWHLFRTKHTRAHIVSAFGCGHRSLVIRMGDLARILLPSRGKTSMADHRRPAKSRSDQSALVPIPRAGEQRGG